MQLVELTVPPCNDPCSGRHMVTSTSSDLDNIYVRVSKAIYFESFNLHMAYSLPSSSVPTMMD